MEQDLEMEMGWCVVESSNIKSVKYTGSDLHVQFKGGGEYKYIDVPSTVFLELLKSESKGKFLNGNIKAKYQFESLSHLKEDKEDD